MSNSDNSRANHSQSLPLTGIRVLDFTQVEFGPAATQVLADFGADVVKVERPGRGDLIRHVDPLTGGDIEDSSFYQCLNRNKRSITVDFSTPGGATLIRKLCSSADVLVENFKPGTLERYGLSYSDIQVLKPDIIYASGSGFGSRGPYARAGGQDLLAQALSGAAMHNRDRHGRPRLNAIAFADFSAGMILVQGILLALLHRDNTGIGTHVEVNLLDTMISAQMQEMTQWMKRGIETNFVSDYIAECFKVADGWIVVAGFFSDNALSQICKAIETSDLSQDRRFCTPEARRLHRDEIVEALSCRFADRLVAETLEALQSHGILCAPVLDYGELLKNPQVEANNILITVEGGGRKVRTVGNPLSMSTVGALPSRFPPGLGEHTTEVLSEFGLSTEEIRHYKNIGVVC